MAEGLAREAEYFAELAFGNTSRNLIQFFFSQDFITRSAARTADRTAKGPVKILGIVGSGIMGTEIARVATAHGLQIRLKTSSKEKELACKERESDNQNIVVSSDYRVLGDCDIVLEAVIEDARIKEALLSEIEKYVSTDCVIATNTSALELIELGQNLKHPQRFVGTHFFYPVEKMQLVEVASHPSTSNEASARALGLVTTLQKTPISVKDSTGFIVNRLLTSHLMEACRLVGSGIPINWVEEAAVQFGLPMGPFTLADELGIKLCITVAKQLFATFGERFTPPRVMRDSDIAGFTGKSADNGVYIWDASGRKGDFNPKFIELHKLVISQEKPDEASLQIIQDQVLLPMIDEAARCLEEKVVRKARELDLAMILGAGFPAFRGGPLRFADQTGISELIERLQKIYELMPVTAADRAAGLRTPRGRAAFDGTVVTGEVEGLIRTPSSILLTMSEQGRRFYASGEN
jgi:3-hydroxyacyl-CoA dehydrogenase/enoyl-CoA hydratase/3-hydroxybutyryl-CoA epimerase